MTNKTIARKRKAIAARVKKFGSASLGASLLLGGSPALANSAAFTSAGMAGGGAFSGMQHHAMPQANLTHAGLSAGPGSFASSHLQSGVGNSFNAAHLHAAALQNTASTPGWLAGGLTTVAVPTAQNLSIGGGNLDLQSTTANVILGARMFNGASSATINVGGVSQTFHPGQKATAAEYVALTEVLSKGAQTLTLSGAGVAVGGDFNLNTAAIAKVASIVIPANVVALDNIASASSFSLRGDLLNYGSVLSYSSSAATTSGTIVARDIVNETGGSISTQSAANPIDLTLVATRNFANAGTVVADGSLNLVSGSGNFANSGLVKATGGNINFSAINDNASINITSSGTGSFQAQSGDINIRNSEYAGAGDVNLSGGNYLSQNLNINSGTGAINGAVGQVSGQLNSVAGVEHLKANTSNLVLGNNTIDGDPTFVNDGDITVSGVNTFTEDVLIIANGNITSANGAQIVDHGHNVSLFAGVQPLDASPSTGTVQTGATGTTTSGSIDFSNPANKGGDINFSVGAANTPIDTSGFNTNGGKVTLCATANGTNGGNIRFDGASTINTSTTANNNAGGSGGNVTVYAGGIGGVVQTINLGNITTSGGGLAGSAVAGYGGDIIIETCQPAVAFGGSVLQFNTSGQITNGVLSFSGVIAGASINIGGTLNTGYTSTTAPLGVVGGNVSVNAGGSLNTGAINASGGNGAPSGGGQSKAGGNGGDGGEIGLSAGLITVNGDITANGGAGGNSTGFAQGGKGGSAELVILSSDGPISVNNVFLNGGNGGNGGTGAFTVGSTSGGAGGSGGDGGQLGINSFGNNGTSVRLGAVSAIGGNGGIGGVGSGTSPSAPGGGGVGGAGGSGGQIEISSAKAASIGFSGNLSVNGGAGGTGGTGGAGGQTGPVSGFPGAIGGNGGAGGKAGLLYIELDNGSLGQGNIIFSAAGGSGGTGGVGGKGSVGNGPSGPVNFASGAGGSGGNAGDAGVVTEIAQTFSAGAINLLGGVGGGGGLAGSVGVPSGVVGSAGAVGTNGTLNITGSGIVDSAIVANNITIEAPAGSNGSITLLAPLTADNQLTLASDGTGTLNINGAILTAQAFNLTSSSGDINGPLNFPTSAGGSVSLSAPNGSVSASFHAPVALTQITAANAVTLFGSQFSLGSGGIISGSSVSVATAGGGSDLTVSLTDKTSTIEATTGDVTITGATGYSVNLNNSGLIKADAGNINISLTAPTSPTTNQPFSAINVVGNGTIQVGATGTITITSDPGTGNPALADNEVFFNGNQTFLGTTVINASGSSGVVYLQGANLTDDSQMTINTSNLSYQFNSSITANPLVLNSGTNGGTIAASGDLDLSTFNNLVFQGASLAILASGSITDSGKAVSINTASTAGAGGAVTIIGGFGFTSSPNAGPTYPFPDTADTFVVGAANTGTTINLAHTSIDSSGSTFGGAVSIYGAGSVAIGAITTKGASGGAGSVTIFGNGVSVLGNIDASSTSGLGGSVNLYAGAAAPNGTTYVANGFVYGSLYSPAIPSGNLLTHSINADGAAKGGNISLNNGGTTVFNIGSTAKTNINGVVGTLSAAGEGGQLYVTGSNSGITNSTALNNFQNFFETSSATAPISLGTSLSKNTQLQKVYLDGGSITESGTFTTAYLGLTADTGNIGSASSGFAVNTPLLDVYASGIVNIKDASVNAVIDTLGAGTIVKFVGAGNVTTTGNIRAGSDLTIQAGASGSITLGGVVTGVGKTTLIAGGTGTITGTASDVVSGASVVLTSKSGAIGTALAPLVTKTTTLTETTTGSTYLSNTSPATLTFNGSNTTGAFALMTDAAVIVAKPIAKAMSIDIETFPTIGQGIVGGITAKGALGGTVTNSIVLATGGTTGAIVGPGALTTKNGGSISLSTGGGNIGTGAVGASTAIKVSTGDLTVASTSSGGGTGTVNINNTAAYAGTLAASSSGGDFNIKTAQSTTFAGIAAGGNLNVLVNAGTLTTAKGSVFTTAEGNVLLEEAATSGKIMFNTGTVISTHSASSKGGNVVVSIGAPPATVAPGQAPTNVTVNTVTTGSAFFGKGITANANGGGNVINLKGSNVTFNVGKAAATAIVLDGDVTITADPVVVGPSAAVVTPIVGGVVAAASGIVPVVAPVASAAVASSSVLPVIVSSGGAADAAVGQSNLAARFGAVFSEPGWISQTELSTGEIPATISSGKDFGVRSSVSALLELEEGLEQEAGAQIISGSQVKPLVGSVSEHGVGVRQMQLKRGSVVFAPEQNTVVHTPHGDVKIAAHSLVMVMTFDQGMAVYNLHDSSANAVSVNVADKEMKLAPGGVAVVTTSASKSFAEINPAQLIGYSNLSERKISATHRAFSGQFSVTQAMAAVLPLRQLVSANNVEAKKLSAKMLKTGAILQQLNGGRYEQVVKPVKMAMGN